VGDTTIGTAAERSGWSPRMLRYLEQHGLVAPERTPTGYRVYRLSDLNRLRALAELRRRFELSVGELAFVARMRREPELRRAVDGWFAAAEDAGTWIDWEQRKHERLLAA
jgi:MerR family copper efflux transcriptional regulator